MQLDRYIVRHMVMHFLILGFGVLFFFWLVQGLRLAEFSIERGSPTLTLFLLLMLLISRIVDSLIPMAVFLAVLVTFHNLEEHNEISAGQALGMGARRFAVPGVLLAAFATVLSQANVQLVLPLTQRGFMELRHSSAEAVLPFLLRAGEFVEITQGVTVWMAERDVDGRLRNLVIYDRSEAGREVVLFAESGLIGSNESGLTVALRKGSRHDVLLPTSEADGVEVAPSARWFGFEHHELQLERATNDTVRKPHRLEFFLPALFDLARTNLERRDELLAEAHRRLALLFWPMAMTLFATLAAFEQRNRPRRLLLLTAFFLALVILLLAAALQKLAASNPSFLISLYLLPLIVSGLSWWRLYMIDARRA